MTAGIRADQALGNRERALVRGVAGSGKSTLLRWLGFRAARTPSETGEPAPVPFVLELARFEGGRPPSLHELIAPVLRPEMPEGWIRRMLTAGRVLLLLDGLDEIPPRERVHVEEWVEEHLEAHPGTRCIVTTRPSIVAEQWWADRDFQQYDLLPMSRHSIDEYVHGWHEAARVDQPGTASGDEIRKELTHCERQLLITLSNRSALRGMSANPLLCGLLCALHLESGEHYLRDHHPGGPRQPGRHTAGQPAPRITSARLGASPGRTARSSAQPCGRRARDPVRRGGRRSLGDHGLVT
ncbi:NACHT domain-containing protein [Streptomyces sp. NPDC005708]|uniref:NACHT domain-containing protein n=1 Tax=Streptomyces sp. NPDC005708 TaxID=3154564 RepID=UPI0033F549FC